MEKVKIGDIADSIESLRLFQKLGLSKLETKKRYWMAKSVKKAIREFELFEEIRIGLVQSLGSAYETKEGKGFSINLASEENQKTFFEKLKELREQEVELEFEKIKLEDLEIKDNEGKVKIEGDLSLENIGQLDWIISE